MPSPIIQTPYRHQHHTRTPQNRNLTPYHARPLQLPGSGTSTPSTGSTTQVITSTPNSRSISPEPMVLRLRGAHDPAHVTTARTRPTQGHRRQITWAEDVIDNEGLGRKSSKVCCIYHRAREVGESSDESSSDSSSESDSDGSESPADDDRARMSGGRGKNNRAKGQAVHPHGHVHGDACGGGHAGKGKGKRRPSPNAYERMPRYTNGTRQEDVKS